MGKVANRKRKELFEELERREELKVTVKSANAKCCLSKSNLPETFVKCIDCPEQD